MENNNQGSNKIICPQITCGIILGLDILTFLSYLIELVASNGFSLFYVSAMIIINGIVFFLIQKGIKERAYSYYNNGFLISIFLSVVSTLFRIVMIIIFAIAKTSSPLEEQTKNSLIIGNFLGIFFDWIEPCVLICYKNKVKNLCEPAYNPNLDPDISETNNAPFV